MVCELGTIETIGCQVVLGGLRAIVYEKDVLLGAVINGEYQEEIGASSCFSTGNVISHGLNWLHGLDIQRLFALACGQSTCLLRAQHNSSAQLNIPRIRYFHG